MNESKAGVGEKIRSDLLKIYVRSMWRWSQGVVQSTV